MLLSLCTPVMNRTDDLKKVMSYRIEAAERSLPIEFVILDYNSQDDLQDFVVGELSRHCDAAGILLTYRKYIGRKYYHQAHAYNLSVMSAHGDYVCIMGADTYPGDGYFQVVREMAANGCRWMEDRRYKGAVCVKWSDFDAIGGYDERFEFYGSEDRDLAMRLARLGTKKGVLPDGMIGNIHTPDSVKMENYRVKMSKAESSRKMREIFDDNFKREVVAVNPEGWAKW